MGFWNALVQVLSPGAIAKIRDLGTFYHLIPENPSAAEHALFWLRLFRPDAKLSTIRAGVDTVVKEFRKQKLEEHIKSRRVSLKFNHTVTRIRPSEDDQQVRMRVRIAKGDPKDWRDSFDHVILALPQWPLRLLGEFFPDDVNEHIEGVIAFPLLKAFLVIKDPWWDNKTAPHHGAHLVPTRELHYWRGDDENGDASDGMMMLYTDRPATGYWQTYVETPHEQAQVHEPNELQDELLRQMVVARKRDLDDEVMKKKIKRPDLDDIRERTLSEKPEHEAQILRQPTKQAVNKESESVSTFAIRDWSQAPFGAACHVWAPKIKVQKALDRLKAFPLLTTDSENIHVCGEAYSDYQGFIEGALRSADSVLETIPRPGGS